MAHEFEKTVMGGCVLRAWGDDFAPDSFLDGSTFRPCNVFTKGARKAEGRAWETSGFTLVISEADDNFSQQMVEAIEFLNSNAVELERLKNYPGVEGLSLDFGVNRRNEFLQGQCFPSELVSIAAHYSMTLEVSIYGP